jgi:hypothetical protein
MDIDDGMRVRLVGSTAELLGVQLLVRGGHLYRDGDTYHVGGAVELRPADTGLRVTAFTLPVEDVASLEYFTWADLPD